MKPRRAFPDRTVTEDRFRLTAAGCGVLLAAFLVVMVTGAGGQFFTTVVDDWSEFAAAAAAAGCCAIAASRTPGRARTGWLLLSVATGSWAAGEVIWSYYETIQRIHVPFPSAADAGFLLAVPFEIVGVLLLAGPSRPDARLRNVLDGLAIAGAIFFVSWTTVLKAVYAGGGDPAALAISVAYPAADVVAVVIVLSLFTRSGRPAFSFALLAAGLVGLAVSDSTFAYLSALGPYATNPVDIGWVGGFTLVALAALRSGAPGARYEGRRARFLIPYVALGVAALTAIVEAGRGVRLDPLAVLTALGLVVLVLVRQLIAVREMQSLSRRLQETVEALRRREEELEHQAFHDSLTRLANRDLFRDRVEHALARGRRSRSALAVILIDLDDFKTVNDSLGHAAGDQLLVMAARRLLGSVRPGDTVARLSGDEFAVLLEDISGPEEALPVARRLVEAFRAAFPLERDVYVGLTAGVAMSPSPGETLTALLRNADVAMYAAKKAGKGRFAVYDATLQNDAMERLELRAALARAIERDELAVHFQPVFDLGSGQMTGAEALVRWRRGRRLVRPGAFIPFAQESGLIIPIERIVLRRACAEAAAWAAAGRDLSLSVNVSATHVNSSGFVETVRRSLEAAGLPPDRLILEITESALAPGGGATYENLKALAAIGVRIAIDDFASGYSAIGHLKSVPVGIVKVDRAFVDSLGAGAAPVLASIVQLCSNLGLTTVAEGIETPGQLAQARSLGCSAAQGYLLGRPVEARRILDSTTGSMLGPAVPPAPGPAAPRRARPAGPAPGRRPARSRLRSR